MKSIIFMLVFAAGISAVYPQANYIQSIDFDSQQRVVYGISGSYDYSYAGRY